MTTTDKPRDAGGAVARVFFSYSVSSDFETHPDAETARAAAQNDLDFYRDDAPEGWSEDVTSICWGEVLGEVEETERRPVTDEDRQTLQIDPCIDDYVDYQLIDAAPSALLAELRELEKVWRLEVNVYTRGCADELAALISRHSGQGEKT